MNNILITTLVSAASGLAIRLIETARGEPFGEQRLDRAHPPGQAEDED
jgi:hypothetical protein